MWSTSREKKGLEEMLGSVLL